jgi:hypothetical protein
MSVSVPIPRPCTSLRLPSLLVRVVVCMCSYLDVGGLVTVFDLQMKEKEKMSLERREGELTGGDSKGRVN